jgi:hypothetical protein
LAELEMYEGHNYTLRTAPKIFRTKVLFIDWQQTVFLPWVATRRQRMHYDNSIVFLLDGQAAHVTPQVITYAGSERIVIVQLVAHLSHLTQPRDVCVFGIFKVFYRKENKIKLLKAQTLKIYHTIAAFHRPTIV